MNGLFLKDLVTLKQGKGIERLKAACRLLDYLQNKYGITASMSSNGPGYCESVLLFVHETIGDVPVTTIDDYPYGVME